MKAKILMLLVLASGALFCGCTGESENVHCKMIGDGIVYCWRGSWTDVTDLMNYTTNFIEENGLKVKDVKIITDDDGDCVAILVYTNVEESETNIEEHDTEEEQSPFWR